MAKLRLTMACWNYDRTRALADGRVPIEGVELNYLDLPVEETFFRMLRHREFDVAEMSLSSYVLSLFQPAPRFVAIPVFPSRVFRHSAIFVNAKSGIATPKDLIGKKVGLPEYQLTANVWIRGILQEHYGVPASSVVYFTGGQETPGRTEKLELQLPPEFRVERIAADKTLAAMLASGEIDAFYGAEDGLQRPGNMVIDSATPVRSDHEAMGSWGYDLMLGKTVDQCKAEIRQSQEWKDKHPNG